MSLSRSIVFGLAIACLFGAVGTVSAQQESFNPLSQEAQQTQAEKLRIRVMANERADRLMAFDADENGSLTFGEVPNAAHAILQGADLDENGLINRTELTFYFSDLLGMEFEDLDEGSQELPGEQDMSQQPPVEQQSPSDLKVEEEPMGMSNAPLTIKIVQDLDNILIIQGAENDVIIIKAILDRIMKQLDN